MIAELVLHDANVITMAPGAPPSRVASVAIGGGRILAAGSRDEIEPLVGPGTRELGLGGKTILPGFIDTHVHFMLTGLGIVGPSVSGLTSAADVLAVVSDAAGKAAPDEPILIHEFDAGTVIPAITGSDLDRVAPLHAVVIGDIGCHACIANEKAWRLLNLSPDLAGIRTLADGRRSGVLVGAANNVARYRYFGLISKSIRIEALHRAAELALRHGITTIHALDGGSDDGHSWQPAGDVELLMAEQDRLPLHTVIYFECTDVDQALAWGLPRIGGCVYVDGAYGEHTAALMEPYTDDPATKGMLYFTDAELNAFVERAHRAGLQVSMHAIGDAAIEQLLNAYERAITRWPRSRHQHRIEHFSLPTAEHVERAARLGVAVAMQPNFAFMPEMDAYDQYQEANDRYLGPERYRRRHPYRAILDAGILVAAGSDSNAGAMGPLLGIHALVNHPEPERRLTPMEALALYTLNGARIAFEEAEKGAIEAGKLADLVVLGADPLTADPRTVKDMTIEMTIVGGDIKYDRTER